MSRYAHPFDRYALFTDVRALKEWSVKPLRKSIRVNTLKCSVEQFRAWAAERGWQLEEVPWCQEGFFVDRPVAPHPGPLPMGEGDDSFSLSPRERVTRPNDPVRIGRGVRGDEREALGKDLLHLIGGFYIQEAASMLPVALLDPQPGDAVLDMSAAPGSKTTQIAARMVLTHPLPSEGRGQGEGCERGIIVANDMQEHRLWTLKSALYRSGVTNAIVTKKVGQWFSKHMTERFDRVLCDAPCTAQGTVRKDSDALQYCGSENVAKMARLQLQLLEAAIHATKVGGRIVYSTCTLTPEENEGVVLSVLERFGERIAVLDPRSLLVSSLARCSLPDIFGTAINDSLKVQKWLLSQHSRNEERGMRNEEPLLRLWPQTCDTEGFFCAVLEKLAPTKEVEPMEWVPLQEERLSDARQKEVGTKLKELYGTDFLRKGEVLLRAGEQLFLTSGEVAAFPLPVQDYSVGLPFAKILKDGRIRLSHEMALLRGMQATRAKDPIDDDQLALFLEGKDVPGDPELHGDVLLLYKDFCIGRALAKDGTLKNNLPRWMITVSQ